jgi:hypothetical protein
MKLKRRLLNVPQFPIIRLDTSADPFAGANWGWHYLPSKNSPPADAVEALGTLGGGIG